MNYEEALKKAVELGNDGNHLEAINYYNLAINERWYCNQALQGLSGSLTWLGRFKEALQVQIRSASCFPDQVFDYFVLKTRVKSNIVKTGDQDLLDYTINALYVIKRLLNTNFHANDFLSEMLLLADKLQEAKKNKYHATVCNAAFSKKESLEIFNNKYGKLPDFFVIGPQKTATTALYSFLTKSKDVYPSINKELFFFNGPSYEYGESWYKCHFPRGGAGKRVITGEATATYFSSPVVPKRMSEMVPDAKLIFTLRDPVKRAISSFFMERRQARETRGLLEAIESEIGFLRDNPLPKWGYPEKYFAEGHKGYVLFGLYEHFLAGYRRYYSEGQIKIVMSEDLHDPEMTVKDVCSFIGVAPPKFDRLETSVNVGGYKKDEEYLAASAMLNDFFGASKEMVGVKF